MRFGVALGLAAVLVAWLVFTGLQGQTKEFAAPSQLSGSGTYKLNGLVAKGAPTTDAAQRAQTADGLTFTVHDKKDASKTVKVVYRGSVPDAFAVGREVVVTGHMQDGVFVGDRNSLITLCPSKFSSTEKSPHAINPTGPPSPHTAQ